MKRSPYYYYVETKKISNPDWKVKYQFLKDNKIDILVIEKDTSNEDLIKKLNILEKKEFKDYNVDMLKLSW